MAKYQVYLLNHDFSHYAVLIADHFCKSEFCKSVANRHANDWNRGQHKGMAKAYVVKAGAEIALLMSERIEVPCKGSYRWTAGYYVCNRSQGKIYPPVPRKEAFALAREMYGDDCKIIIDTEEKLKRQPQKNKRCNKA